MINKFSLVFFLNKKRVIYIWPN